MLYIKCQQFLFLEGHHNLVYIFTVASFQFLKGRLFDRFIKIKTKKMLSFQCMENDLNDLSVYESDPCVSRIDPLNLNSN